MILFKVSLRELQFTILHVHFNLRNVFLADGFILDIEIVIEAIFACIVSAVYLLAFVYM